jgi:hypothetical protein
VDSGLPCADLVVDLGQPITDADGACFTSPRGLIELLEQAGDFSSPERAERGVPDDDEPPVLQLSPVVAAPTQVPAGGEATVTTAAEFVAAFKKPLPEPVIQSPPKLRITRQAAARRAELDDDELVPKRSARLAAKSKNRLHQAPARGTGAESHDEEGWC